MHEVIRRIQHAVIPIRDAGVPIIRGTWGVYWRDGWWPLDGGCCVLGAVLLHEQPPIGINELGTVSDLLGVSVPWTTQFRHGYHAWTSCSVVEFPPYRVGAWFALEYASDF